MASLHTLDNFDTQLHDAVQPDIKLQEQSPANDAPVDGGKTQRLQNEINTLKIRILQLEQRADTDALVQVYSHRAFMREIKRAQVLMSRYDILCNVLFFDLNGFKKINNKFGHSIGDDLLIKIGEALKASVRDCDMVARVGDDKFGVLLFKTDIATAQAKAASLACRIADQSIDMVGERVFVNSAWGVSSCRPDGTPRQILHRAELATLNKHVHNYI